MPVPPPAAVAMEKAIQGTWQVVRSERHLFPLDSGWEGTDNAEDVLKTTQVIIHAGTLKFLGPHVRSAAYEYRINTESSPVMFNVQRLSFPASYSVASRLGIARLDGDELKLCFGMGLGGAPQRPTAFWAELGSYQELLVLKRIGDSGDRPGRERHPGRVAGGEQFDGADLSACRDREGLARARIPDSG